jgi:hypothetical protein
MTPSQWIGADRRGNLRCIAWLFVIAAASESYWSLVGSLGFGRQVRRHFGISVGRAVASDFCGDLALVPWDVSFILLGQLGLYTGIRIFRARKKP